MLHVVQYPGLSLKHEALSQKTYALTNLFRSTFPRPDEPTARARTARSTPSTRSPVSNPTFLPSHPHTEFRQSTRLERLRCSPRESVVMTASSPVMVVRPSPSSTRCAQYANICRIYTDKTQRAKTTKKVVLRLECTQCKTKAQVCCGNMTVLNTH